MLGDRGPADAVEAVGADDRVAFELDLLVLVDEADVRAVGLDLVDADFGDAEAKVETGLEPSVDQVLDDLGLAIDDDAAPVGQVAQRDAVALAGELQVDPVVDDPLAVHPRAHAGRIEHLHGALLEHAGADSLLDVLRGCDSRARPTRSRRCGADRRA